MTELVIEASGLTRKFSQVTALSSLDLQVEKQTVYGFLGPNGSGKTTAIRLLTGLLKPSSGAIKVLGCSLPQEAEKLRSQIGYMTQKFSLYDDLTIQENMQFIARIYGLTPNEQKSRLSQLMSVYQLGSLRQQMTGSLSGGQKQRLALACAVLHKPKLLFLDEPTSSVDPQNRREFWEQLFDLCEQGVTILVSTHFMDEAERCHKLAILENGVKRADDSPETLITNMPAHVVEISSNNLRQIKQALLLLPEVISVSQLGAHLRVLVSKQLSDPVAFLRATSIIEIQNDIRHVRPNLEDVFVTCTGEYTANKGIGEVK